MYVLHQTKHMTGTRAASETPPTLNRRETKIDQAFVCFCACLCMLRVYMFLWVLDGPHVLRCVLSNIRCYMQCVCVCVFVCVCVCVCVHRNTSLLWEPTKTNGKVKTGVKYPGECLPLCPLLLFFLSCDERLTRVCARAPHTRGMSS